MTDALYAPAAPEDEGEEIPDFSAPRKRVAFRIDGDLFEAPAVIPAMVMMDYVKRFESLKNADDHDPVIQMQAMTGVLELVLRPASYARFMERLADRDNPIGLDQTQTAIEYLMGKYGMRPTQPPSDSPSPPVSPDSGTSLTESTQGEVSISAASPSTDS